MRIVRSVSASAAALAFAAAAARPGALAFCPPSPASSLSSSASSSSALAAERGASPEDRPAAGPLAAALASASIAAAAAAASSFPLPAAAAFFLPGPDEAAVYLTSEDRDGTVAVGTEFERSAAEFVRTSARADADAGAGAGGGGARARAPATGTGTGTGISTGTADAAAAAENLARRTPQSDGDVSLKDMVLFGIGTAGALAGQAILGGGDDDDEDYAEEESFLDPERLAGSGPFGFGFSLGGLFGGGTAGQGAEREAGRGRKWERTPVPVPVPSADADASASRGGANRGAARDYLAEAEAAYASRADAGPGPNPRSQSQSQPQSQRDGLLSRAGAYASAFANPQNPMNTTFASSFSNQSSRPGFPPNQSTRLNMTPYADYCDAAVVSSREECEEALNDYLESGAAPAPSRSEFVSYLDSLGIADLRASGGGAPAGAGAAAGAGAGAGAGPSATIQAQAPEPAARIATSSYLDAITEVCEPARATGECAEAITSYLDAITVGAAQPTYEAGKGIASYLDSLSSTAVGIGIGIGAGTSQYSAAVGGSAGAVTSYLDDLSSGAAAAPSEKAVGQYLDSLSSGAQRGALASLVPGAASAPPGPLFAPPAPEVQAAEAPRRSTSPVSYLDAISEVCAPSNPMDQCAEAVTSYLDTLSVEALPPSFASTAPSTTNYLDSIAPVGALSRRPEVAVPSPFPPVPARAQPAANPQDAALERWYSRHGILGGHIRVETTPRSVGCRGVFWRAGAPAETTQIIARIPRKCVLAVSASLDRWPGILSGQVYGDPNLEMMASALAAYRDDKDQVGWKEWIDSWGGMGGIEPKSLASCSSEEIQAIASATGVTFAEVSMAMEVRHNMFLQDASKLGFSFDNQQDITSEKFTDIWTVLVSRCANLGPHWDYERGVIPLHDMMNHPPHGTESNVELASLGDVRPHLPSAIDDIHNLAVIGGMNMKDTPPIDDKDILLVTKRKIMPNEELLLAYRHTADYDGIDAQERLWLMLQYGFSMVPFAIRV